MTGHDTVQQPRPAAQTNLGPAPHRGGVADFSGAVIPPYAGRQQTMRSDHGRTMSHIFNAEAATVGPGREISEAERRGVAPAGTNAESARGVGVSMCPQGNAAVLGKTDEARRRDREEAGINPGGPLDPGSMPNLRPGDQAG